MSVQHAKDFIEKTKHTKEIQKELEQGKSFVDCGRDHGFHFTPDEFEKAMKEHRDEHPEDGPDTCMIL